MRHLLLKRLLKAKSHEKVSMSLAGRRVDAAAGRKEIMRIIDNFRKEGVKRRSNSLGPPYKRSRNPPRID